MSNWGGCAHRGVGCVTERKEVSIGGVDGRDTTGRQSLKRDVKKSAVEFWGSAYSALLR